MSALPRLLVAVCSLWAALPASFAHATAPGENGKIAFVTSRHGQGEIYSINPDGTGETRLTNNTVDDDQPTWSPDGSKIAFVSQRDGNYEIYTMDADGTDPQRLTNNAATDFFPAWSPDGSQIVFESTRDGNGEIYVMDADGTDQLRRTNNSVSDAFATWSPDGSKIAFTRAEGGADDEIFVMNANGTGQTPLTNNDAAANDDWPSFSPDGSRIAFASSRGGNFEIFAMDADGTDQVALTETDNTVINIFPSWSPDGTKIAFFSTRDGAGDVYTMGTTGSGPTRVTTAAGGNRDPDWQPLAPDADGDALRDSWEKNGIDTDGDGTADLDLPAMGADPKHKDIFVEVDFMTGHRMLAAHIDPVIEAFEAAPVDNPDGKTGITLHVDNGSDSVMDPATGATWGALSDQDELTHQDVLGSDFTSGGRVEYDWSQFEAIRQTKLLAVRRPAFHYAIAAHSGPSQRIAGVARGVPAADFVMAMHENCRPPGVLISVECAPDFAYTSSTFMHELGHVLGLQHGGHEEARFKPNYLSVMNYNFGFGLVNFDGTFEVDYSRFPIAFDERVLDEEVGFGIDAGPLTSFRTIYRCPGTGEEKTILLSTQIVDWNCDEHVTTEGTVAADVDADGQTTALAPSIDWPRIVFNGGGIGGLAPPPGPATTEMTEPTPTELHENHLQLEAGVSPQPSPPADPPPTDPPPADPPADKTPPETTIDKKPKKKLKRRKARYEFSSNEAGSSFECKLDRKPFEPCDSPLTLKRLKPGKHRFQVRATDPAGNADLTPAKHAFKVIERG